MTATTTKATTGPLRLEGVTHALFRPVTQSRITGGMWAERRRVNRETSVPGFWDRLVAAGNIHDLELAAGWADGDYLNDHLPFLDTNVHKWVEALAWVLADPETDDDLAKELTGLLCRVTDLLKAAQADDGYLDSYFQVKYPGERFQQLVWGHELYCAGHLIQAAVALHRATGGTQLLDVARPMADLVVDSFGPGRIDGVCGHPEIETALVELYRETGERSYLETAGFFIDRRGHGLLKDRLFGPYYFQDRTPVRDSVAVDGHAVRQLYLLAGVADLYTETGEAPLLTAAERLWADMVGTRTYVTGGVGSHHKDESFGEAYELPNERSYCETCAAIASIQFSWRMLAITGEAKYADLIERTLYNGFLAGVSLDGQRYIYANPLQVRDGQGSRGDDGDYERRLWFDCACCPPNVMRVLGSLQHYVALESEERVLLHQYMPGEYTVAVNGGEVTFTVTTEYPWEGRVVVTMVGSTTTGAWDLALRVPQWAPGLVATLNGDPIEPVVTAGWLTVHSNWIAGDQVIVDLLLTPQFIQADARVDADRGALALQRGPLVYCLEAADNQNCLLDDVVVDPGAGTQVVDADPALGPVAAIRLRGSVRPAHDRPWWPYRTLEAGPAEPGEDTAFTAVPYFAWGNRGPGAMRVWLPYL